MTDLLPQEHFSGQSEWPENTLLQLMRDGKIKVPLRVLFNAVTYPSAPFICSACGETMLMPNGGQSHALCECGELRQIENQKRVRAA